MLVRSLKECPEFIAGDKTKIRELLHPDKADVKLDYSLAHATLEPGEISALHTLNTSEVYYILSGRGRMEIEGEFRDVAAGDTVYIPPLGRQRIEALGEEKLAFLCIVCPAWRAEDESVLE
ncbi:cupin domain-containing protein [bacterium]|nr:MAG: cupin domain-containing protein [bacterium]